MEIKYMHGQVDQPIGEQVEQLARLAAFMDQSAQDIYRSQKADNEEIAPPVARLVSACMIISELSKEEIRETVKNLKVTRM